MADTNEEVRIPIYINDEQAKNAFKNLTAKADEFKKSITEAQAAGDFQLAKKLEKELKGVEKSINNVKKVNYDVNKVLNNLSQASRNDLMKARAELNSYHATLRHGSKEYITTAAKIKTVNAELEKMNNELREQKGIMSTAADGFNKYFGFIAGGIATVSGLFMAARGAIDKANVREEVKDEMKAITGLGDEAANQLEQTAIKFSTTTDENGIRIKQSADDIMEAYKLMGSAKAELLDNTDALASVTKEALILASAAKMEAAPAVESLANIMNQFGAPASDAAKYINILAAGSKAGAAEVVDLADSIIRSGAAAKQANVSIEEEVALIETLAEKGVKAEKAGTGLKTFLLKLQAGASDTNPAIVGMSKALENLAAKNLSAKEMTEQFGLESYTVASLLINNRQKFDDLTKAVTGTNTAYEQAAINSDNNAAKLAQQKNKAHEYAVELGGKLQPAMTGIVSTGTLVLRILSGLTDFFIEHKKGIITVTTAIVAYTVAQQLSNIQLKENIILTKAKVLWDKASRAGLLLLSAAQALFTGNILRANAAMKLFNQTTKLNPYVLLISILAAVGMAIYQFTKRLSAAEKAQRAIANVSIEAQKNIAAEKIEVEKLMRVAQDETKSKEARLKALEELNKISPEYFGNLTLETIGTDKAREATEKYVKALEQKAKVEAAQALLTEIEQKRLEAVATGQDKDLTWFQKSLQASTLLLNALGKTAFSYDTAARSAKNAKEAEEEYLAVKKALLELIAQDPSYSSTTTTDPDADPDPDPTTDGTKTEKADYDKLRQDELNNAMKWLRERDAVLFGLRKELGLLSAAALMAEEIKQLKARDEFQLLSAKEQAEALLNIHKKYQKDLEVLQEEEADEPGVEADIEWYRNLMAQKKALNEEYAKYTIDQLEQIELAEFDKNFNLLAGTIAFNDARFEIEEKYRQMREEATQQETERKLAIAQGYLAQYQFLAQNGTDIVMGLQQLEQEDLEEKKEKGLITEEAYEKQSKNIKKKYADAQFVVALANILSLTAQGVMQSFAMFGPVAGAFLAAIPATAGGIQAAIAVKQRQRVKQLAKGKYNVIGLDDNQPYTANYTDTLNTGLVKQPTLVGEEPEVVWSIADTRKIITYNPALIAASRNPQGYDVIPRVPQRAAGKYPDMDANTSSANLAAVIDQNTRVMAAMLAKPLTAVAYYGDEETRKINKQIELDNTIYAKHSR